MRFQSQHVIVTGGTRGIGAGICEAFLKEGAFVTATFAGNTSAAQAFKEKMGPNLEVVQCDVSDEAQVADFFAAFSKRHPKLDVLVNNAGIRRDGLTATMTGAEWDKVLDTNLKGSFLMTKQAVLLMMGARYGRIVNMSSVGGKLGLPGQANYAASKAGQIALALVTAKEVAKRGITVNNVCPGFIETELLADLPEEQVKEYKAQVPMRRFGKVEEVAAAVLFLASKEASYITGASLDITGGLNA